MSPQPAKCVNPDCPRPDGTKVRARGLCDYCGRNHPDKGLVAYQAHLKVTDEFIAALIAKVKEGSTIKAALAGTNVSPQAVNERLRSRPAERAAMTEALGERATKSSPWPPERQQRVADLIADGMSKAEAAVEIGIKPTALSKALGRHPEFKELLDKAQAQARAGTGTDVEEISYTGDDGVRRRFSKFSADIITETLRLHSVYCTVKPEWTTRSVLALQRGGLITVSWTKPNCTGSWTITGITEAGHRVLTQWNNLKGITS